MTPKEKAAELIKKFTNYFGHDSDEVNDEKAKRFAYECVNECIKAVEHEAHAQMGEQIRTLSFWFEVKSEIENL